MSSSSSGCQDIQHNNISSSSNVTEGNIVPSPAVLSDTIFHSMSNTSNTSSSSNNNNNNNTASTNTASTDSQKVNTLKKYKSENDSSDT